MVRVRRIPQAIPYDGGHPPKADIPQGPPLRLALFGCGSWRRAALLALSAVIGGEQGEIQAIDQAVIVEVCG